MTSSLGVLLQGVLDYAGLFPPASLGLSEVLRRYSACRAGLEGRILGRLIIPAAQMDALDEAIAGEAGTDNVGDPCRVSVIAVPPYAEIVRRMWAFNGRHGLSGRGGAVIDAIEVKARSAADVEDAADAFPAGFDLFVEVPTVNVPAGLLDAAARTGAGVKLRTGGTTPDQIPSALGLATAITACHRAGLSFKATAGLHHPLRSEHQLTYDAAAPRAVVHGFLNVLMAAGAVSAGWVDEVGACEILSESSPEAFRFTDESAAWRAHQLTLGELRAARRFFRSFGSCSIDEPIAALHELGLL